MKNLSYRLAALCLAAAPLTASAQLYEVDLSKYKDYFTQIDLRVTKVIRLYSKSAKLLTNHPAGSYSLDKDAQGQYTLRVLDPQKFWSVSKYLVIVVK